jgi:hypothetical protein
MFEQLLGLKIIFYKSGLFCFGEAKPVLTSMLSYLAADKASFPLDI